jgi:hypothetical protein
MNLRDLPRFSGRSVATAAVCALTLVAAAPKSPHQSNETVYGLIHVTNSSNRAAWMDVSSSYKAQAGWTIERAFCLKPHDYENVRIAYNYPVLGAQVRVRAEVKPGTTNCDGGNISNPQAQLNLDPAWRVGSVSVDGELKGTSPYSVSVTKM